MLKTNVSQESIILADGRSFCEKIRYMNIIVEDLHFSTHSSLKLILKNYKKHNGKNLYSSRVDLFREFINYSFSTLDESHLVETVNIRMRKNIKQ